MINYGLKPSIVSLEHWVFNRGGTMTALQDDGQWDDYLPPQEIQDAEGFDPCSCTSYGTINAIEILFKKMGIDAEYSERFLAIVSNTKCPGNDPQTVCQAIREYGLVDEDLLPCTAAKSYEDYYSPKPMMQSFLDKGREWLSKTEFRHFWVFKPNEDVSVKAQKIKRALVFSPVCVSVYAWLKRDGIYVKPDNVTDGHWCVIYGYNPDGTWKVFDSLDYSKKTLAADYNFTYGKMFSLLPTRQSSFIDRVIDIIKSICAKLH